MTTTTFVITAMVFLTSMVLLIVPPKNFWSDETSLSILGLAIIVFIGGLVVIPLLMPSAEKMEVKVLSPSEYSVQHVEYGLIISHGEEYAFITDYNTVSTFTDTTKVYFVEQRAFYGTNPLHHMVVNGDILLLRNK